MKSANLYPLHQEAANRRHWVPRLLRYFGFFDAIAGTVAGIILGNNFGSFYLMAALNLEFDTANLIAMPLGGLFGFSVGLLLGLPMWALSMAIDDLHALRIYASAYVLNTHEDA